MATQQTAAPPEYSVPFKQRRQRRLDQRHLHFAEPVVTTIDELVVCQAAFSEGEFCQRLKFISDFFSELLIL